MFTANSVAAKMTARQHEHRVGRELYRRHAPLRQCANATQIAGWLRGYEAVYGLEAARTYFAASRQLEADDRFEDVYTNEPGYAECRERSLI